MGAARRSDGSAGDADYGVIGLDYAAYRRPDPSIAVVIRTALEGAASVINVGAGAGSYEPTDLVVTPVEPSSTMRSQRGHGLPAAVDAHVEDLPFPDDSFDAALATFTVHQWHDVATGLAEVRRVTRGPIVILTCEPAALRAFWLDDYAPEVLGVEARRYPSSDVLAGHLSGRTTIAGVPIPLRCTDGFNEAYYGRPEALLDPGARRANSAWSFVGPDVHRRFETRLAEDLDSGAWDAEHRHLRHRPHFDGSLRLIVGHP